MAINSDTNNHLYLGSSDAEFASASLDLLESYEASSAELAFFVDQTTQSVSLSLDPARLVLQDDKGDVYQSNFDATDETVGSLAGSIPGLSIDPDQAQLPWTAQTLLTGSQGNDDLSLIGNKESAWIVATQGNDRLAGSSALLNGVDYSKEIYQDTASGLLITNDPNQTTIVENNLSPLIAENFSSDKLLVYKASSASMDLLADVEIVKASRSDDHLALKEPASSSLLVDGGKGFDTLSLHTDSAPLIHRLSENLYQTEWLQHDAEGDVAPLYLLDFERIEWHSSAGMGVFDETLEKTVFENQPFNVRLGEIFPRADQVMSINVDIDGGESSESWVEAYITQADHRVSDRIIVESNLLIDDHLASSESHLQTFESGTEFIVDLLVSDTRLDGEGLLGLEGVLDWNRKSSHLLDVELNDVLPLFQETSPDHWVDGNVILTAASLPQAGAGQALGDQQQERFARLTFELKNPDEPFDFVFNPTLYPAIGSTEIRDDQIVNLGFERPLITQLKGETSSSQIGTHQLIIEANYFDGGVWVQQVALEVLNVNDAPVNVPSTTTIVAQEDSPLSYGIAELFDDQDLAYGDQLSFELTQSPDWLTVDSTTGTLYGNPTNDDVGVITIAIQARDLEGLSVVQEQELEVLNTNDAPELGEADALDPVRARQGDRFNYVLSPDAFSDPDVGDSLSFSFGERSFGWLTIDPTTGELSGTPHQNAPGDYLIDIVASDRSGASVTRTLSLIVENINDAPFLNAEAAERFQNEIGAQWLLKEDEAVQFDPFTWGHLFEDPDGSIGDQLSYSFQLKSFVESEEITIESPDWIQVDSLTGSIHAHPNNGAVGSYRLILTARDQAGLEASVSFAVAVDNTNDAPVVVDMPADAFRTLSLEEDQSFRIQLPDTLFDDPDLDDQLVLSVSQSDGSSLPSWLNYDAFLNQITGDNITPDAEISLLIQATDLAGATAVHTLTLDLLRDVNDPEVAVNRLVVQEDAVLKLADAITVDNRDPDSQTIAYGLSSDSLPEGFSLYQLDQSGASTRLSLDGLSELASLQGLALVDEVGDYSGTVEMPIELISREINGDQRVIATTLTWTIAAVADAPRMVKADVQPSDLDPFAQRTLSFYANAALSDTDGSELITSYQLVHRSVSGSDSISDLQIVDATGKLVGSRDVAQSLDDPEIVVTTYSLTADEWQNALIRSHQRPTGESVQFSVSALSGEGSRNDTARSDAIDLNVLITPSVEPPSLYLASSPSIVGVNDGLPGPSAGRVQVDLSAADGKDHLAIQLKVPAGTLVLPEDPSNQLTSLEDGVFILNVAQDGNLDFNVVPPLGYVGPLDIDLSPLATARSESPRQYQTLTTDLLQNYAALGDETTISLQVVPIAKDPQILDFFFDDQSGELLVSVQRGLNLKGEANADEDIAVVIQGIPDGYSLHAPPDHSGSETPAGASDTFGTLVLFNIPSSRGDSAINPADPYTLSLFLRSNTAPDQPIPTVEAAELSIVATASLKPTAYLPSGSRSGDRSDSFKITEWKGVRPRLLVDPFMIDLNNDGLDLVSLEDSSVDFDLLNNGVPLKTGWLAGGSEASFDDAFLVVDLNGDGIINATSEMVSEYFSSTSSKRTFLSGFDALSQFDVNSDEVIDQSDPIWGDLQLWFDDGNGRTDASELEAASTWMESIDLKSVSAYSQDESFLDNALLRQGRVALASGRLTSFYDVGLRYDPSGLLPEASLLSLSAEVEGDVVEHGDPVPLRLSVPDFEGMGDVDGSRSLVRLTGLQDGVIPNLGVRDSRGDWVFTWNELRSLQATGADLSLTSTDFQSGAATFEVMVSRISAEGLLEASALTSVRLDVLASAQRPSLQLQKIRISEDQVVALSDFVVGGKASLMDVDGSEVLSYQISGIEEGILLISEGQNLELEQDSETGLYHLKQHLDSLDMVQVAPPSDFSGTVRFDITAIATETSNGVQNSITSKAYLVIDPVADAPTLAVSPDLLAHGSVLQEGRAVALDGIVAELTDTDGSEDLFVEISGLPEWASVQHNEDSQWSPQILGQDSDGSRFIRLRYSDLASGLLQIADELKVENKSDFVLKVSALSREKLNGLVARDRDFLNGSAQEIAVMYSNNAHTPLLQVSGVLQDREDSHIPLRIADVVQVSLSDEARREQLVVRLTGLPDLFSLIDETGESIAPTSTDSFGNPVFEFSDLENVYLENAQENASGSFDFWIEAIAHSTTGGQSSSLTLQNVLINVDAIADQPSLQAPRELFLDQQGRLSFSQITLDSPDRDGSESLGLEITGVPGQLEPLVIKQSDLATFRLSFSDQLEDFALSLRAFSREQDSAEQSVAWSDPYELQVVSGAAPVQPDLVVNGSLSGVEDVPLLLLASQGGVISIDQELPLNQSLSFRISELPKGASIVHQSEHGWAELPVVDGVVALDTLVDKAIRLGPDQYGTDHFNLSAVVTSERSGESLTSSAAINLSVSPVNDAPVVSQTSDLSLSEGESKVFDLNQFFVDPDGDTLNFSLADGSTASWISLAPSGLLTLTPDNDAVTLPSHPFVIAFHAADPLGQTAFSSISVSVGNVNQSPIVNPEFATSYRFDEKESIDLNLSSLFVDPDQLHGDRLQWHLADLPHWLSFTDDQRLIGLPSNDDVGTFVLSVSATDQNNLSASSSISLTINNLNDAPFIRSLYANGDVVRTLEDSSFELDLSDVFADPDQQYGQTLSYTLRSKGQWPSWLQWDADEQLLSTATTQGPSNEDVGEYSFTLNVNDGLLRSSYQFNLVVENTNDAPIVVKNINSQLTKEDSTFALDLSTVFDDVDLNDALDYSLKVFDSSGTPIDTPDWLTLAELSTDQIVTSDVILLKTDVRSSDGELPLPPQQLSDLEVGEIITVDLKVHDLRDNTERAGVIGMNTQLRWNNQSVELVDPDEQRLLEQINPNLPFFPRVNLSRQSDGVLDVEASSAPSFGFGRQIGGEVAEAFISVPFRVIDPSKLIFFEAHVNQDERGVNEIITLDNSLNEQRIQSLRTSTTNSKELLVKPLNDHVGRYKLELSAIDQSGETTSTSFDLVVENVNDAPRIIDPLPSKVTVRDDSQYDLFDLSQTFADDDIGDSFRYEVLRSPSSSHSIDFEVVYKENLPILRLLTNDISQPVSELITIRATEIVEATNSEGDRLDQNFNVVVNPAANLIQLSQTDSSIHFEIPKNTPFNLVESLELFSTPAASSEHDETYLYLETTSGMQFDSVDSKASPDWETVQSESGRSLYRVLLSSLPTPDSQTSENLLSSIILTPPANAGELSSSQQVVLPITLWTESFVKADINRDGVYGLKYGIQESQPLKTVLMIDNHLPLINDRSSRSFSVFIPENGADPTQDSVLFHVASLFEDPDLNDSLSYDVLIPPELKELIAYESATQSVVWISDLTSDTPAGSFVLPVFAYDSHYDLGDKQAYSVASIYFNLQTQEASRLQKSLDDLSSLSKLSAVDKTEKIATIASQLLDPMPDLSGIDPTIYSLLSGLPSIRKAVDDSSDLNAISAIIERVVDSSLSYSNSFGSVIISSDDGSSDITQFNVSPIDVTDDFVELPGKFIVDSSSPKLTFDVDIENSLLSGSQGLSFSIVNIELDFDLGGFTHLVKTRFLDDGTEKGYLFNVIGGDVMSIDSSEINQLNSFMLYGYSPSFPGQSLEIAFDADQHSSVDASLVQPYLAASAFNFEQFASQLDGSAYLLDVDDDGKADIVRMLLLDNGFFDLDHRIGSITDPLIPIRVSFLSDQSFTASSSSVVPLDPNFNVGSSNVVVTYDSTRQHSGFGSSTSGLSTLLSASMTQVLIGDRTSPIHISKSSIDSTQAIPLPNRSNLSSPPEVSFASSDFLNELSSPMALYAEPSALNTVAAANVSGALPASVSRMSAFFSPIMDRIRDFGAGELLMAAIIAPFATKALGRMSAFKSESLKLKTLTVSNASFRRHVILSQNSDSHLYVDLRDGLIVIDHEGPDGAEFQPGSSAQICSGSLSTLIQGTTLPGHALRHCETTLSALLRDPTAVSTVRDWDQWLSDFVSYHNSTAPRLAKHKRAASIDMKRMIKRLQSSSPMSADIYMCTQILHCYLSLGGKWSK